MYNILEHKQAIAENIQKAFGDTQEDIEKAKWQIGEIRTDSRGIAHECYEYTAEGKPRLRRVKKNKGASTTSTDNNGGKKQVDKPEQKTEDLFKVGELKNGFKFKKNTEYVLRYNKYEKQYEVFENKTQRGAGKVPMWVCKSDNGDEKFGEKILKVVQKNYAKEGSTISFGNKIYPLSLNDKKEDKVEENKKKEDDAQSKKKVVPIQETDKAVKLKCLFELEYSPKGGFTSSLVKDKSITIDSWFPKSALEENGSPKDWIIRKREKELSEKYLPLNSQVLSAKLHILI